MRKRFHSYHKKKIFQHHHRFTLFIVHILCACVCMCVRGNLVCEKNLKMKKKILLHLTTLIFLFVCLFEMYERK